MSTWIILKFRRKGHCRRVTSSSHPPASSILILFEPTVWVVLSDISPGAASSILILFECKRFIWIYCAWYYIGVLVVFLNVYARATCWHYFVVVVVALFFFHLNIFEIWPLSTWIILKFRRKGHCRRVTSSSHPPASSILILFEPTVWVVLSDISPGAASSILILFECKRLFIWIYCAWYYIGVLVVLMGDNNIY